MSTVGPALPSAPEADQSGAKPLLSSTGALAATLRPWAAGLQQGLLLGAAVLVLVLPPSRNDLLPLASATARADAVATAHRELDFGAQRASADARRLGRWVVSQGDNGRLPFVLIDKREAQVFVFEASGRLLGSTPVLLGFAEGDDSVVGIGKRPMEQVAPQERTTPAGRFIAEPGRNATNEEVVWVDYEAAVSMHRVRATDPKERRLERLASSTAADNRISYGCINMPVAFFETLLWPALRNQGGIVYVLPETKSLEEVFPALALRTPLRG